jgi:hypothetical protein
MGHMEGGSLMALAITGAALFGVDALAGLALLLWMAYTHYARKMRGDAPPVACSKRRWRHRRTMAGFTAVAAGAMMFGYLCLQFRAGTYTRDGLFNNWSYFACDAVAFFFLGLVLAVYFWVPDFLFRLIFAIGMALMGVVLCVASLSSVYAKRMLFFAFAPVLQVAAIAYLVWTGGPRGPIMRMRGWLVAAPIAVAFILYDVFWFLGYMNEPASIVQLNHRWQAHAGFLAADVLMAGAAVLAIWLHAPRAKTTGDDDTEMAAMLPAAGVSLGGSAGIQVGGFSASL